MHKLIDGLVGRLHDIDKTFVRLYHEILPAVPVDKRTARYVEMLFIRWERDGSDDPSPCPHCGIKNFLTAIINDPAIVCF